MRAHISAAVLINRWQITHKCLYYCVFTFPFEILRLLTLILYKLFNKNTDSEETLKTNKVCEQREHKY